MRFVFAATSFATLFALGLASMPARAADGMGTPYEKPLETSGTIVDLVCELTGACPADCGAGKRQLGVRLPDGSLLPIAKGITIFANAIDSILPYCGKTLILDGLLIDNPQMRIYQAQRIRENAGDKWRMTDDFDTLFQAKNGRTDEWFRQDRRVAAEIANSGVLGVKGLEISK